jgi:fructan beta-fructosidase
VTFPVQAAANDGKNALKIKHDGTEIEVPAEVLQDLQALLTTDELAGAQISFEIDTLSADRLKELMERAAAKNKAEISALGAAYDFKLSIVKADGAVKRLETFSKPVTLRLRVDERFHQPLAGIYYLADDGSLDYVSGTYANDKMTVEVSHFSKYAALKYDKLFEDVPATYWAHDVIKKMAAKQIVLGVSDTAFAPKDDVTRAEFTSLISRALGLKSSKSAAFKDVDPNKWYASSIAAAFEAGIVSGKSPETFAPEQTVSREEMAMMIMKAYQAQTGKTIVAQETNKFKDGDAISSWAVAAVSAAKELGLISGRTKQLFMPHGIVNRAESAQIISLLLDKLRY